MSINCMGILTVHVAHVGVQHRDVGPWGHGYIGPKPKTQTLYPEQEFLGLKGVYRCIHGCTGDGNLKTSLFDLDHPKTQKKPETMGLGFRV